MNNINDLTVGQAKELLAMFGDVPAYQSPFVGRYVIVRCRDAGVHAGVLKSASGRSCVLSESRRLWYFKPANGAAFLSGVADQGLDADSKVGAPVEIELTENCEIIACTPEAEASIRALKSHAK
jgi:hypothetical protein